MLSFFSSGRRHQRWFLRLFPSGGTQKSVEAEAHTCPFLDRMVLCPMLALLEAVVSFADDDFPS